MSASNMTQGSPSLNQDSQLLREWFLHQRAQEPPPFTAWLGLDFPSRPDVGMLERALVRIADRHPVLRTAFTDVSSVPRSESPRIFARLRQRGTDTALFAQAVHLGAAFHVAEGRLSDVTEDVAAGSLRSRALLEEVVKPFDYQAPPLMRAGLFEHGDRYLLSLTLHHLVCDGWSLGLLRNELALLYANAREESLPQLRWQYPDFSAWQRRELEGVAGEATSYWMRRWREFLPALLTFRDFPGVRPQPTPAIDESGVQAVTIEPSLAACVREFCARTRSTPYMAWLAAFVIVSSLHTGRDRVAVLSYLVNRTRTEWESIIGWFSNTFLCGVAVPAGATGRAVLEEVRRSVLEAATNQVVPMGVVWSASIADGSISREFSIADWVSFDYVRRRSDATTNPPWCGPRWTHVAGNRARPELAIVALDTGQEQILRCRYPVGQFGEQDVRQLLRHLMSAMRTLASAPALPVAEYRLVPDAPPAEAVDPDDSSLRATGSVADA